jgi:hypothetical protein
LLAILTAPARAGDFYGGDYYGYAGCGDGYYGGIAYGSGYSYGYAERPYYYRQRYIGGYYDRPYYPYYRSYGYRYVPRHSYYGGYGYASYAGGCYRTRVRIPDGRGGWVWGSQRICD